MSTSVIPLNVFQKYKDDTIVVENSEFSFFYYDRYIAITLLSKYFPSSILDIFNNASDETAFQLWKLVMLWAHGGIYLDNVYQCVNGFKLTSLTDKEYFAKLDSRTINPLIISCFAKNKTIFRAILEFNNGKIRCHAAMESNLKFKSDNKYILLDNKSILKKTTCNIILSGLKKSEEIPLNLFQTWYTKDLPPAMKESVELLKSHNPEFSYQLFDDNDCREFIAANFDCCVLDAFDRLIPGAYKADLWRYCVLYIRGGIYLDIKYYCINEFKLIELTDKEYFVRDRDQYFENKSGIYNALLVCYPRNEILLKCIYEIIDNIKSDYYGFKEVYPTGPGLMGKYINSRALNLTFYSNDFDVSLILRDDVPILSNYQEYRREAKSSKYKEQWLSHNIYKKKVIYVTNINYSNNLKHGNETRGASTLSYFLNNSDIYDVTVLTTSSIQNFTGKYIKVVENINSQLKDLCEQLNPQFIFINYLSLIDRQTVNYLSSKYKVVIDMHDCKESNNKMYQEVSNKKYETMSFSDISRSINNIKTLKSDLSQYNFDTLIHISYEEYYKYKNAYSHINHVYIPFFEKPIIDKTKIRKNVIFVASDNEFNVHAFEYFYKHTLPEIIKIIPEFKLSLYGVIVNKFKNTHKHPNINYVGFVDKKQDIYNEALFAICPLIFGTGSKIKVYEALGYNVPIVSYAFSGCLELQHDKNGLIANTHEEFIQYIIDLYQDSELRTRLSLFDSKLNYNIMSDEMNKIA